MRPIDQRVDPTPTRGRNDLRRRHDERRRAGDVVQQQHPSAGVEGRSDCVDPCVGVRDGKRHGHLPHHDAGIDREPPKRLAHGVVDMIEHDHLVTLAPVKGSQDGVHAFGCVHDEAEPVAGRSHEARDALARRRQQDLRAPVDHLDGTRLDLHAPVLLHRQHFEGRAAEAPVVEKGVRPIEREERCEVALGDGCGWMDRTTGGKGGHGGTLTRW